MRAGKSMLAQGNPAVNVRLLSGFSERGPEASAGRPPPLRGRDELVTRPWPDRPVPGREPACPEMSPGSLQGSQCFPLLVVWAGGRGLAEVSLPLRPILTGATPSHRPTCRAFSGLVKDTDYQALDPLFLARAKHGHISSRLL